MEVDEDKSLEWDYSADIATASIGSITGLSDELSSFHVATGNADDCSPTKYKEYVLPKTELFMSLMKFFSNSDFAFALRAVFS